jgi:hypothetical protein
MCQIVQVPLYITSDSMEFNDFSSLFFFYSFFGKAFEQAAVSTNSRTLHDSFDTYCKYFDSKW